MKATISPGMADNEGIVIVKEYFSLSYGIPEEFVLPSPNGYASRFPKCPSVPRPPCRAVWIRAARSRHSKARLIRIELLVLRISEG